jgi:hypothetical protein
MPASFQARCRPPLPHLLRRWLVGQAIVVLAALCLGAIPSLADNDTSKTLDDASNATAVFDLIGVPELSTSLKLASIFIRTDGGDPTQDAIKQIQGQIQQIQQIQQQLAAIDTRINNDEGAINQITTTNAATWYTNGAMAAINEQNDNVIATLAQLQALQDDIGPAFKRRFRRSIRGRVVRPQNSTYGLLNADEHNRAKTQAFAAVVYTANLMDIGLWTDQSDICDSIAQITDARDNQNLPRDFGNPTVCSHAPSSFWVLQSFASQLTSSYGNYTDQIGRWTPTSPPILKNVYQFQPQLAMPTYFAELRAAIYAMQLDLGGVDIATVDHNSPEYRRYVSAGYVSIFKKNIDFMTYFPCPNQSDFGCPAPYFHNHTSTSLAQSYYFALKHGELTDPMGWEYIDQMRDMLGYAEMHGTITGWQYVKPDYITLAESEAGAPAPPFKPNPGSGLVASCAVLLNCAVASILPSTMVGVNAQGDALRINIGRGQLSLVPNPLWHQTGIKYIMSESSNTTYVSIQSQWLYLETTGQAPASLGSDAIYDSLSTTMFGGGDGVVYFIDKGGDLFWIRNQGSKFGAAVKIGNGWGSMRQVIGAGQGIIYAVAANGDLLWYQHLGHLDGTVRWKGPGKIAKGWDKYIKVVANPEGELLGINADGTADLYQYLDYDVGTTDLLEPPLPNSPASRMKGPFTVGGVDLSQFVFLAGALDATPSGVIK